MAAGLQPAAAAEPATYETGESHAIYYSRTSFAVGEGLVAFGSPTINEVHLQDPANLEHQVAKLQAPAADVSANATLDFGAACALGNSSLLVGASGFKVSGSLAGRVYLYSPGAGGVWEPAGILSNPTPEHGGFGRRIVAKGDRAFVFAPGTGMDGMIHPYRRQADGSWTKETSFPYPSGLNSATSAADPAAVGGIEFDGTTLVLGFPRGMNDRGVVTAYRESGGVWSERFQIIGRSGTTDRLGHSLCFAGSELLMGAPGQGRGRVARLELVAGSSSFVSLPDLVVPGWVREAGAALAYQNDRLTVGAPGTNHTSSLGSQGAVLIADRAADGTWEWSGAVTDPWWQQTSYGRALFAAGNDRFLSYRAGLGGEFLQAMVPGERVYFILVEPKLKVEEGQARSELLILTSRPLNVALLMSVGAGTGSATSGGDFILSGDPEFLWGDATQFDYPVLVIKDSTLEGTETCSFEDFQIFGADLIGDGPSIEIRDEPVDRGVPPQVIGHLAPSVVDMRAAGYWLAPIRMSMTDNELLVAYTTSESYSQRSNPWIWQYKRTAGGAWTETSNLRVMTPTDGADRKVTLGAMVHDESLLLVGEAGDLYARGHLRTYVRDGSGGWVAGASHWPTGVVGGHFGEEIILGPERVFVNQGVNMGVVGPSHSGSVHVFSRNGTQLSLQTELKPEHAGLTGDPWTGTRGGFGEEIAWSAPYLAISLSAPSSNGQVSQGIAIFHLNPSTGAFVWKQNFWFQSSGSGVAFMEFVGNLLVAGVDGRVLRSYLPDATNGMFVEQPPLAPPGSYAVFGSYSRATPSGLLVGMQEDGALPSSAAVPQLAGYERVGNGLRPSLCYGPPFYWFTRPETVSNVTSGGRFAVMHANEDRLNRREIFIMELGSTRPSMSLVPDSSVVDSDKEELRFRLVLDRPSHLVTPVVTSLEGLGGAAANRDFAPAQLTRFFEIGETESEVTFRLLDNPQPSSSPALRARIESGAGLADPFATSPPVTYRKVKAKVPVATQRIVENQESDHFSALAFDGDQIVGGWSKPGHTSRARIGRLFQVEHLPQQSAGMFPRADLSSNSTALHGDLLVLAQPQFPGAPSGNSIQLGRKVGPGAWSLQAPLVSPLPQGSFSQIGNHTATNGRYLAFSQNATLDANSGSVPHFVVYDITTVPARYVGSVTSTAPLIGTWGYPVVAIDERDRLFFRYIDYQTVSACVAVAQITPTSVNPLGKIFGTPSPRTSGLAMIGSSIRIAGDRMITSDVGAVVDGVQNAGAVYVFEETASGWRTSQVLLPPVPGFVNSFGQSIVAERDWLVIGEPGISGRARLHFYRFGPEGYRWISTTKEFALPLNNSRESALGSKLMMAKGCVLADTYEHLPESRKALYAFDLTVNESFADWCAAAGFDPGHGESDQDGDGLPLRLEWAAGGDPLKRDSWWGQADSSLWFRVSGDFNSAARIAVEYTEDLTSGSWEEVAVRDGLGAWVCDAAIQVGLSPEGGQRIKMRTNGLRGFYRLKEGE